MHTFILYKCVHQQVFEVKGGDAPILCTCKYDHRSASKL